MYGVPCTRVLHDLGLIATVALAAGFTLGRAGRGGLLDWLVAGAVMVIFWRTWVRLKRRALARERERR